MKPALFIAAGLLGCPGLAAAQTTVPIDVLSAYLHVDTADSTSPAIPIDLAGLGLFPGAAIELLPVGDWDNGPGGDVYPNSLAVFSASATLLGPSAAHRVPDAVGVGIDSYTGPSWPSNEPTDIPEDFVYFGAGITVVIPPGATHLFVTTADIYYRDNSDPDGDFGVQITLLATTAAPPASALSGAPVAWPNPFERETSIRFQAERAGTMSVTIHDVAGRRVRTLLAAGVSAGDHVLTWDGRTAGGVRAAPGTYFARLDDGERARTVRVSLVR